MLSSSLVLCAQLLDCVHCPCFKFIAKTFLDSVVFGWDWHKSGLGFVKTLQLMIVKQRKLTDISAL